MTFICAICCTSNQNCCLKQLLDKQDRRELIKKPWATSFSSYESEDTKKLMYGNPNQSRYSGKLPALTPAAGWISTSRPLSTLFKYSSSWPNPSFPYYLLCLCTPHSLENVSLYALYKYRWIAANWIVKQTDSKWGEPVLRCTSSSTV